MTWQFAYDMAAYYRWKASKYPILPGNNPLTGRKRNASLYPIKNYHINEAIVAYIAMAKYWLSVARQLRLGKNNE